MGLGRLFVLTKTRIDGTDDPRDLYTSYGRTNILGSIMFLMIPEKIGSIGIAATSLSSKQVFVISHYSIC